MGMSIFTADEYRKFYSRIADLEVTECLSLFPFAKCINYENNIYTVSFGDNKFIYFTQNVSIDYIGYIDPQNVHRIKIFKVD